MKASFVTSIIGIMTYVFGFVIDPTPFLAEHWLILGIIVMVITMAAGHIGPLRIMRWVFAALLPVRSRRHRSPQQRYQAAPAPRCDSGMDYIRLMESDGRRKLLEVKADELRKTEEAKRQAIAESARLKAEAYTQRLEASLRSPVIADAVASVMPNITLKEALAQSSERAWIIGQESAIQPSEHKRTGRLLTFDYQTTHLAIIGATGSGKTESTAALMVLYARQYGLQPIVLDGKDGIDWRKFDGVVEWHSMTPDTIVSQIDQLMHIFDQRWALLKATGASKIYDLSSPRPRTLFVILEEFGDVWTTLKQQDKEAWLALGQAIDKLFRLGRAAGIVLCLIDQAPDLWSKQMRGNAKFVACYKLKGMVANMFNEYHVDKLPMKSVFSQDNVFYRAWWTAEEIDLKRMFPPIKKRYLCEQVYEQAVHRPVHGVVHERADEQPLHEMNSMNTPKEGGYNSKKTLPPSAVRVFMHTGSWDAVAASFKTLYPQAGITELARVMADIVNDGRPYKNFKSKAAQYFQQETH